ncbi:MAG: N-acetyltransferase, partial [Planctomycetota bacterium]|nr:N-acetyltransferase [Planctomycetota bacterium]
MNKTPIEFLSFTPEIAHHFKSINQEWIEDMFEMEETDQAVLNDPQKYIITPGGQVWFARHPELG